MGVALRGCFAPGKGGHGASTSPEGCFYVNKKRQLLCADMACFRAEGLANRVHPVYTHLAGCPCAVNSLDNGTGQPFRDMFRDVSCRLMISLINSKSSFLS